MNPTIPKIIHRIWCGPKPMPEEYQYYGTTWERDYPTWEHWLWDDAKLDTLPKAFQDLRRQCRNPAEVSDVARYWIVNHYGGVYLDTDFESYRSFEGLLEGREFVTSWESESPIVACAFFASIPAHPILREVIRELKSRPIDTRVNQVKTAGPLTFTKAVMDDPDFQAKNPSVLVTPHMWFYPFSYGVQVPRDRGADYAGAYAGHHWGHTWQDWWVTITFQIVGDGDKEQTIRTIRPHMGEGDVITTDEAEPIRTMFVHRVQAGDVFLDDGVQNLRKSLRHAPNYGEANHVFPTTDGAFTAVQRTIATDKTETYKGPWIMARNPSRLLAIPHEMKPDWDEEIHLPESKIRQFNGSVCRTKEGVLFAWREGWEGSRIRIAHLLNEDAGFWVEDAKKITLDHPLAVGGQEDPRLFEVGGRLHLAFAGVRETSNGRIVARQLFAELDENWHAVRVWEPNYLYTTQWEKNWMPFDFEGELGVIYSINPWRILHMDGQKAHPVKHGQRMELELSGVATWPPQRGGTPPILVDDEYYTFFHWTDRSLYDEGKGPAVYSMGCLTFDADTLLPRRMTRHPIAWPRMERFPSTWHAATVFPCGAFYRENSKKFVVSYGEHDQSCRIMQLDHALLLARLEPVEVA